MSKKKSNYIIYTDGGCAINPGGPGGCAAVIINTETGEYKTLSEGYVSTTNNRMEMQAIILALNAVDVKNLTVYSDSTYVIKTMNGQFSKKKNNPDCAKAILTFAKSPRITFKTYAAIKTGGIDYWSRKTRKAMSEYLNNADQLWEILSSYFPEEKGALTAMRWYMRGLPVKDCIRKVLVDQEISYNCIRK